MLILTRKDDQGIKIGSDIEIKIIESAKNSVKIGIEAPKDMLILRTELIQEIAGQNRQAAADNAHASEVLAKNSATENSITENLATKNSPAKTTTNTENFTAQNLVTPHSATISQNSTKKREK